MFYDDYQSSLDRIQDLSEKLLFRVSNLEINLKIKFLIYYSSYYSGISKELFKKNRKGSANNTRYYICYINIYTIGFLNRY